MHWQITTTAKFMRRRLVTLSPADKVLDGIETLLKNSISGAPVIDADGKFVGVFSEKCCMHALTDIVELACQIETPAPRVREFMTTSLVTLNPDDDVFDAIDHILTRRISGAPILDDDGNFLGVFSEKTAMRVLISAAYERQPSAKVIAYIDTDVQRLIRDSDSLIAIARMFQQTPYRRLPVLTSQELVGQVSRRDVIRAELGVAKQFADVLLQLGSDELVHRCHCEAPIDKFMDTKAISIAPTDDILSVAQVFLDTPYRRLAVVDADGKLVGQVSRRDLLSAFAELLEPVQTLVH